MAILFIEWLKETIYFFTVSVKFIKKNEKTVTFTSNSDFENPEVVYSNSGSVARGGHLAPTFHSSSPPSLHQGWPQYEMQEWPQKIDRKNDDKVDHKNRKNDHTNNQQSWPQKLPWKMLKMIPRNFLC